MRRRLSCTAPAGGTSSDASCAAARVGVMLGVLFDAGKLIGGMRDTAQRWRHTTLQENTEHGSRAFKCRDIDRACSQACDGCGNMHCTCDACED